MIISMIAAMGSNRVIGKDNDLPWHLPDDFKFFKETTKGRHIIMGRKNWDSLPLKFRPLPGRPNLVVTRQNDFQASGAEIFTSLEEAIERARKGGETELFIIGGGEIYRQGLEYADKIYLTEINGDFDGQTTFPTFDLTKWKEADRSHHPKDERHAFSFDFVTYLKE